MALMYTKYYLVKFKTYRIMECGLLKKIRKDVKSALNVVYQTIRVILFRRKSLKNTVFYTNKSILQSYLS